VVKEINKNLKALFTGVFLFLKFKASHKLMKNFDFHKGISKKQALAFN
jgi:hypothetical protein